MNENQRKQICIETVKRFGTQEWFRDVTIYNSHPVSREATMEFKVNYIPLFERKYVIEFAASHNLRERFQIVDKNGNPVE
jgi:hypothetical protein